MYIVSHEGKKNTVTLRRDKRLRFRVNKGIFKHAPYCNSSILLGFYGISTIVSYLMPNHLYAYIEYVICKHILLITF